MEFRVATWNVRRKKPLQVWDQLNPNPDVYLLQETSISEAKIAGLNVCGKNIGDKRTWGSAIVSQKYSLQPIELKFNSHPGALVVANLNIPDNPPIQLISVYGLMIDKYSITTMHRMLSDLTPLIDNYKRKNIILAGDFNASLQFDDQQSNHSHKILFERIKDFGFEDCLINAHPKSLQTWRMPGSDKTWQLDYFYASKSLFSKLKSCNVVEHVFSDHHPIVAVFDL